MADAQLVDGLADAHHTLCPLVIPAKGDLELRVVVMLDDHEAVEGCPVELVPTDELQGCTSAVGVGRCKATEVLVSLDLLVGELAKAVGQCRVEGEHHVLVASVELVEEEHSTFFVGFTEGCAYILPAYVDESDKVREGGLLTHTDGAEGETEGVGHLVARRCLPCTSTADKQDATADVCGDGL